MPLFAKVGIVNKSNTSTLSGSDSCTRGKNLLWDKRRVPGDLLVFGMGDNSLENMENTAQACHTQLVPAALGCL